MALIAHYLERKTCAYLNVPAMVVYPVIQTQFESALSLCEAHVFESRDPFPHQEPHLALVFCKAFKTHSVFATNLK